MQFDTEFEFIKYMLEIFALLQISHLINICLSLGILFYFGRNM